MNPVSICRDSECSPEPHPKSFKMWMGLHTLVVATLWICLVSGDIVSLSNLSSSPRNLENATIDVPAKTLSQVHLDLLATGTITEPLLGTNGAHLHIALEPRLVRLITDFTRRYTADITPLKRLRQQEHQGLRWRTRLFSGRILRLRQPASDAHQHRTGRAQQVLLLRRRRALGCLSSMACIRDFPSSACRTGTRPSAPQTTAASTARSRMRSVTVARPRTLVLSQRQRPPDP